MSSSERLSADAAAGARRQLCVDGEVVQVIWLAVRWQIDRQVDMAFRSYPCYVMSMNVFRSLQSALKAPGQVRALELADQDRLPEQVFEFEQLIALSLPWIKRLPKKIGKLKKLEVLSLAHGQAQLPASVGELSNLRELYYSAFRKGLEVPKEIGKLKKLRILNLFCSKITSIPNEVYSLENLEILSIQECHALEELPAEIGGLKKLRVLIACDSVLSRIPFEVVQLAGLEIFDFDRTPLAKRASIKSIKGKKSIQAVRRKLARLGPAAQRAEFKKIFGC